MLNLYAKRLAQENADDVCAALKLLEGIPRQEGESAMPDIGTILEVVDEQRQSRQAREKAQLGEERLLRLECPLCKHMFSAFVREGDPAKVRYCRGIPKREHYAYGEVCGGTLQVIENIPAKGLN